MDPKRLPASLIADQEHKYISVNGYQEAMGDAFPAMPNVNGAANAVAIFWNGKEGHFRAHDPVSNLVTDLLPFDAVAANAILEPFLRAYYKKRITTMQGHVDRFANERDEAYRIGKLHDDARIEHEKELIKAQEAAAALDGPSEPAGTPASAALLADPSPATGGA
jgi:hypothetical protein